MKPTDTLQLLKEWITKQREDYRNSNFETDEKKIEAIQRQLVLVEVETQIVRCEHEARMNYIDNMPYASHITPEFTNLMETFKENAK